MRKLPGGRQVRPWLAYVFTVLITLATFGLRFALDSRLGGQPTFVIFTLPIMLSAYVGGLRAGLLATTITCIGGSFYLSPPMLGFAIASEVGRWQMMLLALTGVAISTLSEALLRSRLRAELASSKHREAEQRTQAALDETQDLRAALDFAMEAATIGDWELDLRTNVARRSLRHDQCFGYAEMLPEWGFDTFLAHVEPGDRDRVDAAFRKAMAGDGEYSEEFRTLWPDGSEHWLWTKGRFYFDETGQPIHVAGVVVDISQRKVIEDALKQSAREQQALIALLEKERAKLIAAQAVAKIGSWETDLATGAVTWSPETHRIFRTDPATFHPTHSAFLQLVHPEDRAMVNEAFQRGLASSSANSVVHRIAIADGRTHTLEEIWQTSFDEQGQASAVVGTCQDITERKEAEGKIAELNRELAQQLMARTAQFVKMSNLSLRLSRLEEAERRNISRELHDTVGPNLVALKLSLGMMQATVPAESSDGRALKDARDVLEQTIAQMRNVMSDLRPPALDDYGLLAAIRSYADRYRARIDAEVEVRGTDLDPRPSLLVETGLFRIAQEALNNIAKHSHARHVVISASRSEAGITLSIADDGVGFDDRIAARSGSMGLKTMRERAEGLGAVLRIETRLGGPTRITAELAGEPA